MDQLVLVAVSFKASAAVHRTIALGLERHLGGVAAAIADHVEHLTLSAVGVVLIAAGNAAIMAAGRIVLESLVREELLFRSGEHEFLAAVTARKSLVFKHCGSLQNDCFSLAEVTWSWVSMLPNNRGRNQNRIP